MGINVLKSPSPARTIASPMIIKGMSTFKKKSNVALTPVNHKKTGMKSFSNGSQANSGSVYSDF
jgi:hypothetical protein